MQVVVLPAVLINLPLFNQYHHNNLFHKPIYHQQKFPVQGL